MLLFIIRTTILLLFAKVLPYWDWTYIYEQDCLIENPYYVDLTMTKEDCKVCKKLKKVEVFGNISQEEIAQDFLFQDIPVVVDDAIDSWAAKEKFNVAGILKVHVFPVIDFLLIFIYFFFIHRNSQILNSLKL